MVRKITVIGGGKLNNYLDSMSEDTKNIEESFEIVMGKHKLTAASTLFLLE